MQIQNKVTSNPPRLALAKTNSRAMRHISARRIANLTTLTTQIKPSAQARIKQVAVANPSSKFVQQDIPAQMGITDPRLARFFEHDHIETRHLYLPQEQFSQVMGKENFGGLLDRFLKGALEISGKALAECLTNSELGVEDIDFICCVTSTGFIVPTLSARFIKEFGLRANCQRADIVGMGCSAGLNGLNTVSNWCNNNPNKNALLICVEICSAIYAVDDTPRTAVVNSLFGDGAAVALMRADGGIDSSAEQPRVIDFESHLIPEHSSELRFDWDEEKGCYSFFVGRNTPEAMASVVDQPLDRLLKKHGLEKGQIKHWIMHGGGNSVVTGMRDKLNLDDSELRHTRSVLKEFGNLSSGSFLFSFKKLREEQSTKPGDIGLMITMGPGLAIEMALIQW